MSKFPALVAFRCGRQLTQQGFRYRALPRGLGAVDHDGSTWRGGGLVPIVRVSRSVDYVAALWGEPKTGFAKTDLQ